MTARNECHEEHEHLAESIARVDEKLEKHDEYAHAELLTRDQIEKRDGSLDRKLEELGAEVLGPRFSSFHGSGRDSAKGLSAKVDRLGSTTDKLSAWADTIEDRLQNGGIRSKLNPVDRTALWVAIIAALASVVSSAL